ncbi:MAG: hypothetical protein ACRDRO_19465 [Pseudonocardiaceae bacterium]
MRFGTRVLPMVGLLATLGCLAVPTTAAGRRRGGQRRGDPPGRADVAELPGSCLERV